MGKDEVSEVARNAIWTEHCVREGRTLNLSLDFGGIRSPKKMDIIPDKPHHITPLSRPKAEEIEEAKAVLAGMTVMQHEDKSPEQIYTLPITGNQEYGFFHSPLVPKHNMFYHPKGQCDVTKYSDEYCKMTGTSPYKRTAATTAASAAQ